MKIIYFEGVGWGVWAGGRGSLELENSFLPRIKIYKKNKKKMLFCLSGGEVGGGARVSKFFSYKESNYKKNTFSGEGGGGGGGLE